MWGEEPWLEERAGQVGRQGGLCSCTCVVLSQALGFQMQPGSPWTCSCKLGIWI